MEVHENTRIMNCQIQEDFLSVLDKMSKQRYCCAMA